MKNFREFLIEKSNTNDPESKVLNDWLKQSKTDSNNALNKIKEHLKSDFSFKNFETSYAKLHHDILSFCICQAIYLELKSLIGKKSYNDIYDEINANALKVFGPNYELKRQIFDQHLFDQTKTHEELHFKK